MAYAGILENSQEYSFNEIHKRSVDFQVKFTRSIDFKEIHKALLLWILLFWILKSTVKFTMKSAVK